MRRKRGKNNKKGEKQTREREEIEKMILACVALSDRSEGTVRAEALAKVHILTWALGSKASSE